MSLDAADTRLPPPRGDADQDDVWWECLKDCGCFFTNPKDRDEHTVKCDGEAFDTWL